MKNELPATLALAAAPRPTWWHWSVADDEADEFEDDLAAEMLRTGAIEQW